MTTQPSIIIVPANERWVHEPEHAANLAKALAWAQANLPKDDNVDAILTKLKESVRLSASLKP